MQKYEEIETLGKSLHDNSLLLLVQDIQSQKYFMLKKITLFTHQNSEQSLLCEAKILKELAHPHILKYYDIQLHQNHLFQVLEFCEYGSIFNYLEKRKQRNESLSEKLIISWLMQILMALQYLNQKRIVHRLLTIDNVYMNHQGDLKIGSFGKAKLLENTLQKAQTIVGQPCNLSPEMVQGEDYDSKTDIWSLGCLIYHLATFQPPFKYGNLLKLYDSIVQQPCPQLPVKYSKYLSPLYKKMMKKNPSQRPSASQLLEEEVFTQLMKEYLKKKKIDSIQLKKIQPKPLIVQKKMNMERKSNKIKLEPLISTSRVSVKSPLQKQKDTENQGQKTSRIKTKNQIYNNEFQQSCSSLNGKLLLPVIKNKSGQYKSGKVNSPLNTKINLQEKGSIESNPNKELLQTPKSKIPQLPKTPKKVQKLAKDPLTQTKKFKDNELTKLLQVETPSKRVYKCVKNQNDDQSPKSEKESIQSSSDREKQKEKQYIQLLYRVKLQYLEEKYSPNMSKILEQTTEFESFKDLLS